MHYTSDMQKSICLPDCLIHTLINKYNIPWHLIRHLSPDYSVIQWTICNSDLTKVSSMYEKYIILPKKLSTSRHTLHIIGCIATVYVYYNALHEYAYIINARRLTYENNKPLKKHLCGDQKQPCNFHHLF